MCFNECLRRMDEAGNEWGQPKTGQWDQSTRKENLIINQIYPPCLVNSHKHMGIYYKKENARKITDNTQPTLKFVSQFQPLASWRKQFFCDSYMSHVIDFYEILLFTI